MIARQRMTARGAVVGSYGDPVIVLAYLTKIRSRAFTLADNKLDEYAPPRNPVPLVL